MKKSCDTCVYDGYAHLVCRKCRDRSEWVPKLEKICANCGRRSRYRCNVLIKTPCDMWVPDTPETSCETCLYRGEPWGSDPCNFCEAAIAWKPREPEKPKEPEKTCGNCGDGRCVHYRGGGPSCSHWVLELKPKEDDHYVKLKAVLDGAFQQASAGKGKERHADDNNFEDQPICAISRLLGGDGGVKFQAIKKIIESGRLDRDAAVRELYGAINYIAAAVVLLEEKEPPS